MELSLAAVIGVLGLLAAVLIIMIGLKPGLAKYFRSSTPTLQEIDDVIDSVLFSLKNKNSDLTVNEIFTEVRQEVKKIGYRFDEVKNQKLKNRLHAKLKRAEIDLNQ